MKKIYTFPAILTSILATILLIPSVQAGYAPQVRNTCTLMVKPYNTESGAIEIKDDPNTAVREGEQYINYIGNCSNYLSYVTATANFLGNNQYKIQPPDKNSADTAIKSNAGNIRLPITNHQHNYYNDSFQDSKNGQTYYYRAIVKSFEIKLEKDSVTNIEKVACYTPRPLGTPDEFTTNVDSCNRSYTYWGGTTVQTINNADGTRTVKWVFGTNNTGIAYVLGNDPGINPNLSNAEERKLPFSVDLTTKNQNSEIWSASTTSRVLISEQYINVNNYPANNGKGCNAAGVNSPQSGWCYLDPPPPTHPPYPNSFTQYVKEPVTTPSGVQNTFYWLPIGSVGTIWRKTATPDLSCADLQWDGAFQKKNLLGIFSPDNVNPNALLADEAAVMKFKTIYESGGGVKRPLEYHWVAFYGDQNRPAWFTDEDTLFVFEASQAMSQYLSTSLPPRLLKVAHAAAQSAAQSAASSASAVSGTSASAAQAAAQAAMLKIGAFKDELNSVLSGNPLIDNDQQIYYSGGSEGVTVGIQAYYADGKNISGDGPMVTTTSGQKQKAKSCHLELVIQPPPVNCIDLDISPSTILPNTPVTFTVTPKFNPSNKTIPLNYRWSADQFSLSPQFDLGDMNLLPGSSDADKNPTWVGSGIFDIVETSGNIGNILNGGCPPNCEYKEPLPGGFEVDPLGPVTDIQYADFSGMSVSGNQLQNEMNGAQNFNALGANIFADFGTAAAVKPSASSANKAVSSGVSAAQSAAQVSANNPAYQQFSPGDLGVSPAFTLQSGGFKDSSSSSGLAINPFLETVDNKTYYTGGPGNTVITVKGEGKDGKIYPLCKDSLTIPPSNVICKLLKVKFLENGTEVAIGDLIAGHTYTIQVDKAASVKSDNTPITKYTVGVYNNGGPGSLTPAPGNAASCSDIVVQQVLNPGPYPKAYGTKTSTSVDCKYVYTPKANDQINLLADPHDNVADCQIKQTIPAGPGEICEDLNLTTSPVLAGSSIAQGQLVAFSTNPRDTGNALRDPVVYSESGNGYFVSNSGAGCPAVPAGNNVSFEAPSSCKYSYQAPDDQTAATVTIKVKQDDGVPNCSRVFNVPSIPDQPEICLALNLRVNGQYTLNPLIQAGQSYTLQVDPMTTKGHSVNMVEWTENGGGKLIGVPGNPGVCPASIDNGSAVTLSVCRYIFASPADATNIGFSVRAVPDDGVFNCRASAQNYTPPQGTPYCLYLDLDYTPEPFNPLTNSQMNATVVMSDGSKYNDYVRFNSTNGAGYFSGGYQGTSGSGTSDFRTQTDSNNNTRQVSYANGNSDSGINIFLSDTSVKMSAACQRQLRPQPTQEEECENPPRIVKHDNKQYCAEEGDSASYCWTIDGAGNPLFNNGKTTATGNCVTLNGDYSSFDLKVEDCNPQYRDYCFDTLEKEDTPKLEKRISKHSPLRYGTKINYSTTGSQNQIVDYKIEFTPANYQDGNSMLVRIHDPAFTGKLQGWKTSSDGESKGLGGTIDFSNIENTVKISGYGLCQSGASRMDKCFLVDKAGGYLEIRGITSPDKLTIEYSGQLKSGLTNEDCQLGEWCNEQFINQSYVTDMQYCREETDSEGNTTVVCEDVPKPQNPRCEYFYNEKGEKVLVSGNKQDCEMPKYTIASNTTLAELVCQYFLTRASGDVFMEDDLVYGIDVSKCYPFKNISSTVVKPVKPIEGNLAKTGTPEVVNISHEICSAGQSNFDNLKLKPEQIKNLKELFGSDISKLSSQICEVGLVPGSDWNKENISASISQNIGKLTRWSSDFNPSNLIQGVSDIPAGGVYYYKGNGDTVTIDKLSIPEGSGALTIIVENADLQINGNIEYSATGAPADTADKISSLGVIVLDGNMYVAPNVDKLAGAYFIQRTADATDPSYYLKGNVISGSKAAAGLISNVMLTVNGSIYGNIGPLFDSRVAAGDISKDEGAITIRYDQRIIQNPPAGLAEILGTFSQSQIAQ